MRETGITEHLRSTIGLKHWSGPFSRGEATDDAEAGVGKIPRSKSLGCCDSQVAYRLSASIFALESISSEECEWMWIERRD